MMTSILCYGPRLFNFLGSPPPPPVLIPRLKTQISAAVLKILSHVSLQVRLSSSTLSLCYLHVAIITLAHAGNLLSSILILHDQTTPVFVFLSRLDHLVQRCQLLYQLHPDYLITNRISYVTS